MITRNEILKLFGTDYPTPDGTCIRDYIHVEDLPRAHVRALEYLDSNLGSLVVNVGAGNDHSVREVIKLAEKISGLTVPIIESERRPGDPASIFADPAYELEKLNWRPQLSLEDIVSSSYDWYRANPEGYLRQ